jgi:hypothetical protein
MDFLLFQLAFAAVMLALLVALVFAVRSTLRTRQARGGLGVARAPARTRSQLLKGAGAPEQAAEPKTARKRQIGPAAKAAALLAEPRPEMASAATDEGPAPAITAPELSDDDAISGTPQPPTFRDQVMARLEEAFDGYTSGDITLADYIARVRSEEAGVDFHLGELRRDENIGDVDLVLREERIDDALCARDAIQWCLEWAEGQSRDEPA